MSTSPSAEDQNDELSIFGSSVQEQEPCPKNNEATSRSRSVSQRQDPKKRSASPNWCARRRCQNCEAQRVFRTRKQNQVDELQRELSALKAKYQSAQEKCDNITSLYMDLLRQVNRDGTGSNRPVDINTQRWSPGPAAAPIDTFQMQDYDISDLLFR